MNRTKYIGAVCILTILLILSFTRASIYETELALWMDVILKAPSKARGYNNVGFYLKNKGEYQSASFYLERAIALKPDYLDAKNNLAIVYRSMGKRDSAMVLMNQMFEQDPEYLQAHFTLGLWYFADGLRTEALREFQFIIQQSPDSKQAQLAEKMSALLGKNSQSAR